MPVNPLLQNKIAKDFVVSEPKQALRPWYFAFGLAGVTAAVALAVTIPSSPYAIVPTERVDDWMYAQTSGSEGAGMLTTTGSASPSAISVQNSLSDSAASAAYDTIGLSAGGAEDVNSFRLDIENGYTPLPTDLTYEGLFSEYSFDTGAQEPCAELFCPSYTTAVAPDPFSDTNDYYLSVGLNSGIKESDFARKPLNLVVVLDISGSMSSSLDTYHYDSGIWDIFDGEQEEQSKMDVAKQATIDLFGHLNDNDRLGVVLFDDTAVIAKPLRLVGETDMDSTVEHVREIEPQGGTDMSAGIDLGTSLFEDVAKDGYENRIIFLTDAMPNRGDLTEEGMRGTMEENAANGLYTTFIGIGVDFQTELVEAITKTQGANYYAVHTSQDFRERMDEGFDYMVTPLVFDLDLSLDAEGYSIEQVYGSPEANEATGEIMHVNTLFPSLKTNGETKGGIILLKLTPTHTYVPMDDYASLSLRVSYKDRDGKAYEHTADITFPTSLETHYDNSGIKKAIWLARYADLMHNWMIDAREAVHVAPDYFYDKGLTVAPPIHSTTLSRWEQQSTSLTVPTGYHELFSLFRELFAAEMNDSAMQQELDILDLLLRK